MKKEKLSLTEFASQGTVLNRDQMKSIVGGSRNESFEDTAGTCGYCKSNSNYGCYKNYNSDDCYCWDTADFACK